MASSTRTGWKRRSRAASLSKYLRYSSSVVAPTTCSSPLARAGFNILDASMEPSAPPAPIMVCISSIKRMTSPADIVSVMTLLIRSSNSPLYLDPATMPARSRFSTRQFFTESGTLPLTMRCARPSTMAVFPTPGSPTRQGLFLVRLLSICTRRLISVSLPTMGSSFPSAAWAVRSLLYLSSIGVDIPEPSCCISLKRSFWNSMLLSPMASKTSVNIFLISTPMEFMRRQAAQSASDNKAKSICSVPISAESVFSAISSEISSTVLTLGEFPGFSEIMTSVVGATSSSMISISFSAVTPFEVRTHEATPCPSFMSPSKRCSVPI